MRGSRTAGGKAPLPPCPPPTGPACLHASRYSQWLSDWVTRLEASPSDELLIVARGQHVARWKSPRNSYPEVGTYTPCVCVCVCVCVCLSVCLSVYLYLRMHTHTHIHTHTHTFTHTRTHTHAHTHTHTHIEHTYQAHPHSRASATT